MDEGLDVKLAREDPVGGELAQQDAVVFTCDAIGTAAENEPGTADGVVDGEVATGLEIGQPIVVIRRNRVHNAFTSTRRTFQSDGHPTVVAHLRESGQKHGIQARRNP